MTRAAHVRLAPLLERLIRADPRALVVNFAVRGLDLLAEHVVEPLVREVTLLLGHPFLQSEMRIDDERSVAHWTGAGASAAAGGASLFQVSRINFHLPSLRRWTVRYFPLSTVAPDESVTA